MKGMHKIISIICACVLFLNAFTAAAFASETGTEENPYIITTAKELQNINNNVSAHYKLGANINLADEEFTPIGNVDTGSFTGSFDGNGYTVYNLDVYSGKYAGLFGSNEGVVKNVVLENVSVYGTRYIGGVVAYNTSLGTVESCKVVSGIVETDGGVNSVSIGGVCGVNEGVLSGSFSNGADVKSSASGNAGGICGYWNTALTEELENVYNTGNITAGGSSADSYSGGLIGYVESTVNINGSYNTGNVTVTSLPSYDSSYYFGGLIGYAKSTVNINDSYNIGSVTVAVNPTNKSWCNYYCYSGGLVGYAENTTNVNNSYNIGNVTATIKSHKDNQRCYSGGLFGYAKNTTNVSNSYNTGSITTYGLTYRDSHSYSGGFVGYAGEMLANNSYNTGDITANAISQGTGDFGGGWSSYSYSGGFVGKVYYTVNVANSYNTGNINTYGDSNGDENPFSGGFAGAAYGVISNSYNTGKIAAATSMYDKPLASHSGGLMGRANCSVINSFSRYGSVIEGDFRGTDGVFLSSSDMKKQSAYIGWDFDETWGVDSRINEGYPILKTTASPLSLDVSNKPMPAGSTLQLTAYKNGVATNDVTWSANSDKASVSKTGLVTAGGVGFATVTATDREGNKANFNTYVFTKATSLSAEDRTINLSASGVKNESYFTVNGSDSDYIVSYKSSDTSVLTVDGGGYITPLKLGVATVTATTAGGASATQTVTVEGSAAKITLPSEMTVSVGETKKITAKISPDPTTSAVTWKSSDPLVAAVDNDGNVRGLKSGTTVITAEADNGVSGTCTVTVNAPITEMTFENPSLTLYLGEAYKLKLNITPANTTDTIKYSVSDSNKASVSSAGVVTISTRSSATGTVTVTATASSGQKAYCNITIKSWPDVLKTVDNTTNINRRYIVTDANLTVKIKDLVTAKTGYSIAATPAVSSGGISFFGTGSIVDVYDEYGNLAMTYTLIVKGDLNGDSVCDALDASLTEMYSVGLKTPTAAEIYAANGSASATEIDVDAYQYVVNKCLSQK